MPGKETVLTQSGQVAPPSLTAHRQRDSVKVDLAVDKKMLSFEF